MKELRFTSHGVRCAAWHLPAGSEVLAGPAGRPCIVMAHGFGGTRDTGLLTYAEPIAAAGIDVLVFDYRGFGASEGEPRQDVSVRRQRQDYHAAIDAARHLPGVDADRIVLWGTSYSGGHVIAVAAQDRRVAATVALTPATDGIASLLHIARHAGIRQLIRATWHGLRDVACALIGRTPHHVPIVGAPGSSALMTSPGAEAAYTALAGPTWRNAVCARAALAVAFNRPVTAASRLQCPVLLQVGSQDRVAPPGAARRAARKAAPRAQLREYPADHFDVYDGPWQQRVLADQLEFLTQQLKQAHEARRSS